jgi:hypothetical protein
MSMNLNTSVPKNDASSRKDEMPTNGPAMRNVLCEDQSGKRTGPIAYTCSSVLNIYGCFS